MRAPDKEFNSTSCWWLSWQNSNKQKPASMIFNAMRFLQFYNAVQLLRSDWGYWVNQRVFEDENSSKISDFLFSAKIELATLRCLEGCSLCLPWGDERGRLWLDYSGTASHPTKDLHHLHLKVIATRMKRRMIKHSRHFSTVVTVGWSARWYLVIKSAFFVQCGMASDETSSWE